MNAVGWYLHSEPVAITGGRTVSEVLAEAERQGYAAVRVVVEGGSETFRRIGGEWICTAPAR